jgi:hypothetical protein
VSSGQSLDLAKINIFSQFYTQLQEKISYLKKGESFENIVEKLNHTEFQLFNTFMTFSHENIRIFQETT